MVAFDIIFNHDVSLLNARARTVNIPRIDHSLKQEPCSSIWNTDFEGVEFDACALRYIRPYRTYVARLNACSEPLTELSRVIIRNFKTQPPAPARKVRARAV